MAWTSPKTWAADDVLTASDFNTHIRDNLKAATEWTAYTPTWAATGGTPTIGNGTLTGRYLAAGDLCHFNLALTMGSTTSLSTHTAWTFSLPVTGAATAVAQVWALDAGTAYYGGAALIESGSTTISLLAIGTGSPYGYNQPFTWTPANADRLVVSGTYEI